MLILRLCIFLFPSYHTNTDVPKEVNLPDLPKKINRRELALKWEEPESNGADIESYTVYKRLVTRQWMQVATTRVREYLIELESGNTYEFCITATNKCGEGRKETKPRRVTVLAGKLVNLKVTA